MKINKVKLNVGMMLGIILLAACSNDKNRQSSEMNTPGEVKKAKEKASDLADVSFIDGMTDKVFHNYLQLQRALFNSDLSEAQTVAGNLSKSFSEEREELKSLATRMAESQEIDQLRTYFSDFTGKVEPLFKSALSEGTIYKQYCPMAMDNHGAFWFANVSEINNPYFGERMAKCGKTEEIISK